MMGFCNHSVCRLSGFSNMAGLVMSMITSPGFTGFSLSKGEKQKDLTVAWPGADRHLDPDHRKHASPTEQKPSPGSLSRRPLRGRGGVATRSVLPRFGG